MSTSGHLFISYSRKQFYFTESLILHLQEHQVETWFDVQRLIPGTNWEQSVQEGYDSCVGLILVASRASLASDYVQKEWEAVLKAGKPIYIVLSELVQLPPELENVAAIVDFRGNFHKALKRLLQVIQQRIHYCDPLPPTNILRLPTRLPISLWCVIGVLWLLSIMSIVFFLSTVPLFPQVPHQKEGLFFLLNAIYLILMIYALVYSFMFLYRCNGASYKMLRLMLWTLPVSLFLIVFMFDPALSERGGSLFYPINVPYWFRQFSIASFLLMVIGVLLSLVLSRLKDALRWFPTGALPEEVRRRRKVNNRRALSRPKESLDSISGQSRLNLGIDSETDPVVHQLMKPGSINPGYNVPKNGDTIASGRTRTYWLHYDVADKDTAHQIQKVLCRTYGLSKAKGTQADVHIVVLSDKTTIKWFKTLNDISHRSMYIVTSSIRMPKEEENFYRLQWIDYRLRQVDHLERVREFLDEPLLQMSKYNYPTVPESLERFVIPPKIFWLSRGIGSLSLYPLSDGISSLLLLFLHGRMFLAAPMVIISLLSGGLSVWLSYQVNGLKLPYGSLLTVLGLVSIGVVLSGLNSPNGISSIMLLVFVLCHFVFAHRVLKEHLPRHTKLFSQQPTFSIPFWRKDVLVYIFLLLGIAEVVFLRITLHLP